MYLEPADEEVSVDADEHDVEEGAEAGHGAHDRHEDAQRVPPLEPRLPQNYTCRQGVRISEPRNWHNPWKTMSPVVGHHHSAHVSPDVCPAEVGPLEAAHLTHDT